MRKLLALMSVLALVVTLMPASSYAAGPNRGERYKHVRHHPAPYAHAAYVPANATRAYAAAPGYYAAGYGAPHPLVYPLVGAGIGAIIGAAVCPPCSIAGSALTSGGGALVGAGIGAVGGTVVGAAVQPPVYVGH
ncbi:MAG: hypothetical protein H3C55_13410 [Pseudorhodoplanes sp.]|nr:hypothetical protein [Pseudorhodoplanes sp.]MBW7950329.1 hypothetical protein [Pseudorhodoplanes sp.]MCQ3941699.1 hypothetical protein [Alphaproteobacteria bacterium]GIK81448.1 MAG: hypothetical protein BroJett024_25530 [Alphaproteobacteria bacterium]